MEAIDYFNQDKDKLQKYCEKHGLKGKQIKKAMTALYRVCHKKANFDYHIGVVCNEIIAKSR